MEHVIYSLSVRSRLGNYFSIIIEARCLLKILCKEHAKFQQPLPVSLFFFFNFSLNDLCEMHNVFYFLLSTIVVC